MRDVKRWYANWADSVSILGEDDDEPTTVPMATLFVLADDYERTETARGHLQKRCARYKAENLRLMEAAFAVIGDSEDWQCDCAVCDAVREACKGAGPGRKGDEG